MFCDQSSELGDVSSGCEYDFFKLFDVFRIVEGQLGGDGADGCGLLSDQASCEGDFSLDVFC